MGQRGRMRQRNLRKWETVRRLRVTTGRKLWFTIRRSKRDKEAMLT